MVSKWAIWPGELNPERFLFFFRITYNAGQDWRFPFFKFSALCDFFRKKNVSPRGPLFNFLDVSRHNGGWKIPNATLPPFWFFSGNMRLLFQKLFPQSVSPSIYWCFATMDVKISQEDPLLSANSVHFLALVQCFWHSETFFRKTSFSTFFPSFFSILRQNGCSKIRSGPFF